MSRRTARWLAWILFGLFVALAGVTLGLVLSGNGDIDQAFVVLAGGFALVGALVASREPGNAVGWLMLTIALSFGFQALVDSYIAEPGRPAGVGVAWVSSWVWFLWLYLAGLTLPLVFPDGRLLTHRWRIVLWAGMFALTLSIVSEALRAGPLDVESPVPISNPFGLDPGPATAFVSGMGLVGDVLAATGFVLGAVSLVLRLRTAQGRQRQQLKWFVFVGALALGGLVLAMVAVFAERMVDGPPPVWANLIGGIGWMSALLLIVVGLPVAVGISMLRYRLYDIDLVIKRTLVYGSLTLLLAATYLTLVLTFRILLDPLTGESDLAVAASTLAVAALFRPVRDRVQALVDRRFFRGRYDAAQTVESFVGRLRQEVDLDAVSADLGGVVRETMQPAHVSLWLRGSGV